MMKKIVARSSRGFSLIEVTLALGVAGFCLLALFGLLPIGVSSNQAALEQTAAASVAASVVADLRATPLVASVGGSDPVSTQFGIPVPSSTTSGKMYTLFLRDDGTLAQLSTASASSAPGSNAKLDQNPRYRVTLIFAPPASNQLSATPVRVLVTWPAVTDPTAGTLPTKFSGSFETVTALDRH